MARQLTLTQEKVLRDGITGDASAFRWACQHTDRINIVAEGDSWFAYPKKHLLWGKRSNILDWVARSVYRSKKVNLLRLASNGDEAVAMLAGEQKMQLAEILKSANDRVDLILFSGGGNDVVGKWDMERLLRPYEPGFTATDCIHTKRFQRKLLQIRLAYEELIELRDEYAPSARIVTHTYDFLKPSKVSARFVAGLVSVGPWIYPYLVEKNIPENLHQPVVIHLLTEMRLMLEKLAARPGNRRKLFVVNTQGTLRPGHGSDWKDEMHPTSSGFKRLSRLFYKEMRRLEPGLPAFTRK